MSTNWNAAIEDAARLFSVSGIDDAHTNAEYLAAWVLGVWKKDELREYLTNSPSDSEKTQFDQFVARRLLHEPLQYIIGETEFFGLRLFCSPAALIPRPETEILVEEALKESEHLKQENKNTHILDIGTGSGAVILAIASRLPNSDCIGIDISEDALVLAQRNTSRLHRENVRFAHIDFLQDEITERFDLIVSNPPYIPFADLQSLPDEVRTYEPRDALTDRSDGFTFYKAIAEKAKILLEPGGSVIVETEFKGAIHVREIFREHGLAIKRTVKDLLGFERVVVASLK
ncbi:MAG TPA: peptide chain release factor N(5)-glutamine methyltransferase [Candidatus Kapabacteria bacterium]|nr:peptide chain release factor N(5)-glutamine methyltransferase [Candidatus Kapabacteria bacterium]